MARILLVSILGALVIALAAAACASPSSVPASSSSLLPRGEPRRRVVLRHLGVAGWSLEGASATLLVDPYLTRADPVDDDTRLVPDLAAIGKYAPPRADAILVGHSHYDHVLDVPEIARRTGAVVVGTESTSHLALASGLGASQVRVVHGGEELRLGPFEVRVVRALHSMTGQANESIPAGITLPLAVRDYGEGGTLQYLVRFEGRSVYFVGTANFVEDELRSLRPPRPEVAVVAVGLRRKIPDYTCRLLGALGRPPLVLANHFDAFRQPLHPGAMELDEGTRADLAAFTREVEACAPGTRVVVPIPFGTTEL